MKKIIFLILLLFFIFNKPALAEGFRPELVQTGLPGLPNAKIFYTEFASNGVKNCGLSVINNYEVVASLQFKLSSDFSCMIEFSIWTQEGLQRQGIGKCLMDHALAKLDTNNPLCKSSTDYIFSPVRGRGVNYQILQSKISQTSNCPDSVYKALCETPTAKHLVRNGFEPLSCKELLTAYKVEFVPQPECGRAGPHSKVFYLNGAAHELKYPTGIYNSINPEDFVVKNELNRTVSQVDGKAFPKSNETSYNGFLNTNIIKGAICMDIEADILEAHFSDENCDSLTRQDRENALVAIGYYRNFKEIIMDAGIPGFRYARPVMKKTVEYRNRVLDCLAEKVKNCQNDLRPLYIMVP